MDSIVKRSIVQQKFQFPCLLESKTVPGMVVFFHEDGKGIVVSKDIGWKLGKYSEDWDTSNWKLFEGSVELVNTPN